MTGIVGFYGLMAMLELLPLLLTENLGIVGRLFRDWKFKFKV